MLDRSRRPLHTAVMSDFLGTCGVAFAAYLLCAGSVSASELATGGTLAVLVAIWCRLGDEGQRDHFAFSAVHARVWARAGRDAPKQTLATAAALCRTLFGRDPSRADERRFRLGNAQDPAERARRASAVLAASLAPASYVVEVGPDRDRALLHGIGATPPPTNGEWLA